MSETNNIFFYLEEKVDVVSKDNSDEIEQMMCELENIENIEDIQEDLKPKRSLYFYKKKTIDEMFGINNTFFYEDYTVKELMRICNYYDIEKHVKSSKCKKQDIISSIVYFESLPENFEKVEQRHLMWSHMTDLMNDSKMKKYIIW